MYMYMYMHLYYNLWSSLQQQSGKSEKNKNWAVLGF